jgi:septum formation inhibitor-activating ATPase MinD
MAQVITIISNDVKSGKTTIAFSLATILANKNKKVLLVNQEYGSSYLELLTKENKTISKNVIAPFVMIEHTKRLTVLLFSNGKVNQNKHDYSKLFPKQLQLLESKFEYIIIDASYI